MSTMDKRFIIIIGFARYRNSISKKGSIREFDNHKICITPAIQINLYWTIKLKRNPAQFHWIKEYERRSVRDEIWNSRKPKIWDWTTGQIKTVCKSLKNGKARDESEPKVKKKGKGWGSWRGMTSSNPCH